MNVAEAIISARDLASAAPHRVSVRPFWLRPLALAGIMCVHAALLLLVTGQPAPLTALDTVEVTLEPEGDSAVDQARQEEVTPAEQAPPPAPVSAAEPPELTAPPPQVVAPEAIPLPIEKPKPIVKHQFLRQRRARRRGARVDERSPHPTAAGRQFQHVHDYPLSSQLKIG